MEWAIAFLLPITSPIWIGPVLAMLFFMFMFMMMIVAGIASFVQALLGK